MLLVSNNIFHISVFEVDCFFHLKFNLIKTSRFPGRRSRAYQPRLFLKKNKAFFIFKKILAKATFLRW